MHHQTLASHIKNLKFIISFTTNLEGNYSISPRQLIIELFYMEPIMSQNIGKQLSNIINRCMIVHQKNYLID